MSCLYFRSGARPAVGRSVFFSMDFDRYEPSSDIVVAEDRAELIKKINSYVKYEYERMQRMLKICFPKVCFFLKVIMIVAHILRYMSHIWKNVMLLHSNACSFLKFVVPNIWRGNHHPYDLKAKVQSFIPLENERVIKIQAHTFF